MLKIPAEDKLINARQFYDFVYNEWQRVKERSALNFTDEHDAFVRYGDTITTIIGEFTYDMPPADAKYIKHGTWVPRLHDDGFGTYLLFHCSECDCPNANKRNYCPECGAKMRGAVNDSNQ